nr:O-antigen ligase family protein [Sphingomonas sp. R-74633]
MVDHARVRQGLAVAISLIVVPLILVTGSRAGLIAGAFGLLAVPFLYRAPEIEGQLKRGARRSIAPLVIVGASVLGVAAVTILLARGQAFDRLIAPGQAEDARFGMWGPIAHMASGYFPFGSGLGSFQQVYQIQEPLSQLRTTYVNHAHNDWLEIYLTAGLCGLLALVTAVVAWAVASLRVWRQAATGASAAAYGRLGSVVLLILGFASVGDYPLRVPSLACFAVVAAVWLLDGMRSRNGHLYLLRNKAGAGAPEIAGS